MPWESPVQQRKQFIKDALARIWPFTALCARYGVSTSNGYKWLKRYKEHGEAGLYERSRAPQSCPHKTPPDIEKLIISARKAHPTWGAGTLVGWIANRDPAMAHQLPAPSTAHAILVRHGLVKPRRRHRSLPPTTPPTRRPSAPNDVWTMDFKGEFRTRDHKLCYPLTIADDFSRMLLTCKALPSTCGQGAKPHIERAFRDYGLPRAILTDNGAPFGSTALARLSRLSVWWIRLGIRIERIEPAKPTQNARHERMHRTLKRDTVLPPAGNARAQQRRFNNFRYLFDYERPHSAHGGRPPASVYCTSPRPYPQRLPQVEYPGHYLVRKVSCHGYIRLRGVQFFLSRTFRGQFVGLNEIHNDLWAIHFGDVELARYDSHENILHTGGAHGPRALNASHEEKDLED